MHRRIRRTTMLLASSLALPLLAFHRAPVSPASPATLQIKLFTFTPKTLAIALGDSLVVTNADDTEHTITFGTPDTKDARLTPHVLGKSGSAVVVPKDAGVYPFFCERHPFMTGTLTVTKR